jgi:hypothetical protein
LIGITVVLALVALGGDAASAVDGPAPSLAIDPCVDVDEATVREVMDLELAAGRAGDRGVPDSVTVRCAGDAQEIEVGSSASPEQHAVRTIQLAPVVDAASPAARQARSRELALAIAELVRRLEIASTPPQAAPPPQETPPPPSPPPLVTAPAMPPAQAHEGKRRRWRVGLAPSYDYFAGGYRFVGGDVLMGGRLGRRFVAEIRVGGRAGAQHLVPAGRLSASAAIMGASAGVLLWPESRHVGLGFMLHAEEYLVRFQLAAPADAGTRTALLGAFVVAAGPRLTLALGRRVALEASAAVGFPPHGIVVRVQGATAESLSGLVLSGSLAGVLRF